MSPEPPDHADPPAGGERPAPAPDAAPVSSAPFLEELYQQTPVMMQSLDPQGRVLDVNQQWLARMGYTRDEVIGHHITEWMTPECARIAAQELSEIATRERFSKMPREYLTKSGEVVEAEVDARVQRDATGRVVRTFGAIIDVTERNRMERALRAREEDFRNVVEYSPDGIVIHQGGVLVYANRKSLEIFGATSQADILGRAALDLVHPDYRERVKERIRRIREEGTPAPLVTEVFIRLNGEPVDVEARGVSIVYQGQPAVQVAFRDITERKRVEEMARRSAVQEEVIRAQREALLAISTPLIPLSDRVVMMPLVGAMDEQRGDRATETLLLGISSCSASIAIVDVTGVPAIGAGMAETLRRAMHAARLLGAEVVLTGIQPGMARTMVELDMDLSGITLRGTLRAGIEYAFSKSRPPR